jgi:hypothetical protein
MMTLDNEREQMSRYKVISEWEETSYDREPQTIVFYDEDNGEDLHVTFAIQVADIKDTKSSSGTVYKHGAHRVVKNGKAVKGKGGTAPFFGETAWSDAVRLFDDLTLEARRAAW